MNSSLGDGVYFAEADHVGFFRRFAAMVIDFFVLLLCGVVLWCVLAALIAYGMSVNVDIAFFGVCSFSAWLYLTVCKTSKLRTVGYRLTDMKIVTLKGKRPSIARMTFRSLLWMIGPFNIFLDLMWLAADTELQSLRDCYAGTCVVRNGAKPIGEGAVHLAYYTAMGMTFIYPRVVRTQEPA